MERRSLRFHVAGSLLKALCPWWKSRKKRDWWRRPARTGCELVVRVTLGARALTGQERAGGSAEERSRRLRDQAARLEAQAQRFEQGARGERRTAAVLNPRSGDGWYVLHDLAVPGSNANIDHIVVAPAGVFVVDSKEWSGRISDGSGTLWVGRYPKRKELETLEWERRSVETALRASLPTWPVLVRSVISLTGDAPSRPILHAGEVIAVGYRDLGSFLARAPSHLGPEHVATIARVLDSQFRPRIGTGSSVVRPDPLPPMPVVREPTMTPPPSARAVLPPSRSARAQWAPSATRRSPARPRANDRHFSQLIGALGGLVFCLIGLAALPSTISHVHIPVPETSTPTSSTVPPRPPNASWSCPGRGNGWTVTLAWPAGDLPGGTTAVETAPSSSGPWSLKSTGEGAAPLKITGIPGGTTEWVRTGNFVTLAASGAPISQGDITAPVGC